MSFDSDSVATYEQFASYDFDGNNEYLQGLEAVYQQYLVMQADKDGEIKKDLDSHTFDVSKIKDEDKEQLQTQAKVFFFCKQTGNILDLDDYKRWEASKPAAAAGEKKEAVETAPYSASYEELVDMIVNNKPIPGIKKIPDTVLDPDTASKHVLKERRKPWEKEEETKPDAKDEKDEAKAESKAEAKDTTADIEGEKVAVSDDIDKTA